MKLPYTKSIVAIGLLATGVALAQGYGPGSGPGYGPGMSGGYGPGMGGYGPGAGGGYGPGMMGRGYGPGMMGGYGAGPLEALKLSDEQRDKIVAVQEENRAKNWAAMGEMRSQMFKLRRLLYADSVDANTLAEQQKKVDELSRDLLKSRVQARKQMEAVLTPEQKKQLRGFGPWWLHDEGD